MITTIDIEPPITATPPPPRSKNKMEYALIIKKAWEGYDASKSIKEIEDISAMVSTTMSSELLFMMMILLLPSYRTLVNMSILKKIIVLSTAYQTTCFTLLKTCWLNHC